MFNVKVSLKLITTCSVIGSELPEFIKQISYSGDLYTFVKEYNEDDTIDYDKEFDVMIFKLNKTA